jgi:hypothetical protein
MISKGYQKRDDKRRNDEYSNFVKTKIVNYKFAGRSINYIMIKNLYNLFYFHFVKQKIPFLDKTNYKNSTSNDKNLLRDFRDGLHFKENYYKEIEKGKKIILFNLFMDGTNINAKKKKSINNIYLEFLNDYLDKEKKKKFIYNIGSITKENLKIAFQHFMDNLVEKFKEIEKIRINKQKIYTFLFNFIGDNQQIYQVISFFLF